MSIFLRIASNDPRAEAGCGTEACSYRVTSLIAETKEPGDAVTVLNPASLSATIIISGFEAAVATFISECGGGEASETMRANETPHGTLIAKGMKGASRRRIASCCFFPFSPIASQTFPSFLDQAGLLLTHWRKACCPYSA